MNRNKRNLGDKIAARKKRGANMRGSYREALMVGMARGKSVGQAVASAHYVNSNSRYKKTEEKVGDKGVKEFDPVYEILKSLYWYDCRSAGQFAGQLWADYLEQLRVEPASGRQGTSIEGLDLLDLVKEEAKRQRGVWENLKATIGFVGSIHKACRVAKLHKDKYLARAAAKERAAEVRAGWRSMSIKLLKEEGVELTPGVLNVVQTYPKLWTHKYLGRLVDKVVS